MKNLYDLVANTKGAKIATVEYITSVDNVKKLVGGTAHKVVRTQIGLGWSYENSVNSRLAAQGDERTFESQGLPKGMSWVVLNKILQHENGTRYVRCYKMKGVPYEAEYFVNGVPATSAQVALLKAKESARHQPSATQAAEGLVVNQVKPFNIKFENVLVMSVSGETYTK
jgi:hypothetical protein